MSGMDMGYVAPNKSDSESDYSPLFWFLGFGVFVFSLLMCHCMTKQYVEEKNNRLPTLNYTNNMLLERHIMESYNHGYEDGYYKAIEDCSWSDR
jgi:hypothetical protein